MSNFEKKEYYEAIINEIKNNKFLTTQRNNKFLLHYLEAKLNGGYGRIEYEKIAGFKTCIKKARNIVKIDEFFKKDFDKITEEELLEYRGLLNDNKIMCNKTLVEWKKEQGTNKAHSKIISTKKPLSYRTKKDYVTNFKEFYEFIKEFCFKEEGKTLQDITKYFKIRRPDDYSDVVVKFIKDEELNIFLNSIKNRDFKAMIQLSLMSGARPCEAINIRYGTGHNLYKNSKGKWIIHLPKIKRISYKKYAFEIDMYEEELYPYFNNLKLSEGELVFKTTEDSFRKLMKHYSNKYVGKNFTPKILRKTARMIRTNANYPEAWTNKLMGHSPNSKIQAHYVEFDGIKNDKEANERLKAQQYPHLKEDYEKLKLEVKAQQERDKAKSQELKEVVEKLEKLQTAMNLIFDMAETGEKIEIKDGILLQKGKIK